VRRHDPGATVMVLPSDHHIGDEPAFRAALERAVASAESGPITTIGITPTRPETGYGYIESGLELGDGAFRVERFVEKPDHEHAEEYVASGRYFWNSGMFFFRADVMLEAIRHHLPDLHAGLTRIEQASALGPSAEQEETARVFEATAAISIDYGIMERVSPLNLVPASFGWSDLGSWQSAWELSDRDLQDNALDPGCLAIQASGNLVRSLRADGRARVTALVGVDNLCVVDTVDALLIIPRARAQDVRLVVDALRERKAEEKL
jgi:mannose-1-phosphate guanylyltransferase